MVEVLSQDEIEALLSAMGDDEPASPLVDSAALTADAGTSGGGGATAAAAAANPRSPAPSGSGGGGNSGNNGPSVAALRAHLLSGKEAPACQLYDFRRPDKFSKDQMRTLQMLHETFARLYASSLSAYLRTSVHIELLSIEQIPYEEFMRSLTGNPLITIFSFPPLGGQALMEADQSIFFSMMDRLLGGPGHPIARRTELTEIEKTLATQIMRRALREIKTAWETILPVEPHLDGLETSGQFVQIVPPNDIVILLLFQLKVGDVLGTMTLCLPYVSLKPIASKLSAQRWFASNQKKNSDSLSTRRLSHLIQSARIPCIARLGTVRVTVDELLRLAPGDTLITSTPQDGPVDIMVGNRVKFRAQAGTLRRKMVVRIKEQVTRDPAEEDPLAPWR